MQPLLIRHAEPDAAMTGVVARPLGCTGLTEHSRAVLGGQLLLNAEGVLDEGGQERDVSMTACQIAGDGACGCLADERTPEQIGH